MCIIYSLNNLICVLDHVDQILLSCSQDYLVFVILLILSRWNWSTRRFKNMNIGPQIPQYTNLCFYICVMQNHIHSNIDHHKNPSSWQQESCFFTVCNMKTTVKRVAVDMKSTDVFIAYFVENQFHAWDPVDALIFSYLLRWEPNWQ